MGTAKEDILARIRDAHKLADSPASVEHAHTYRTESPLNRDELREMLIDRLVDYKAEVKTVSSGELGGAIVDILREHGDKEVRYAQGLDAALFSSFDGNAQPDDVAVDPRSVDAPEMLDWYRQQGREHSWN